MAGEPDLNSLDYFRKRLGGLKVERNSFDSHIMGIASYFKPRRSRFFLDDINRGERRDNDIINNIGTGALRIAKGGMMAGTMSPARPWFRFETPDRDLMEFQPVKIWLRQVEDILFRVFADSNFYSQGSKMIEEELLFGTGCMTHVDDFEDVARFYHHTFGSYWIAQNERQRVNTLYRETMMTAQQIIDQFGLENASSSVRTSWERHRFDQWYPVVHAIERNPDFRPGNVLSKFKAYRSVYYEPGGRGTSDAASGPSEGKFLSKQGFDEFPAYVPRWDTTDGDVYGTDCPGMMAIGDNRQLQTQERRKGQAIDKMVAPPLDAPASYKSVNIANLPGGTTIAGDDNGSRGLRAVYQVDPRLQEMRIDMDGVEKRINTAFFVDMFLAISNIEGIQPRNIEDLTMRNEERLLQLGPVLEHQHGEFLAPAVDRTFNQCTRAGILPPPPPELSEVPLRTRFVSTLALAQRAAATQSLDRFVAFVGNLRSLGWEQSLQKLDADQAADEYAEAIGVRPTVVVPDEVVGRIREQQAQQLQAEQQLAAAESASRTAQQLAGSPTDGDNALTEVANA